MNYLQLFYKKIETGKNKSLIKHFAENTEKHQYFNLILCNPNITLLEVS